MREKINLLRTFAKQHKLEKSSLIRFSGAFLFSALSGVGIVYFNYETYWKVTIERVQTVDFNILANILPSKLSTQLLSNDKEGLQTTLDSNYGLFGIVVTNCNSANLDCPQQKITYASKSIVNTTSDGKQKLEPQNNEYSQGWTRKINDKDYPAQQLNGDFLVLRDPPPLKQEWKFKSPRISEKISTGETNIGNIIGRVYLLRGNPPSFQSEMQGWLKNPSNTSSKTVVYNAIAGSALLTGLIVWLLSELAFYIQTNANRQQREAGRKISVAAQREREAQQKADEAAQREREAQQKADEAAQREREAQQKADEAAQREREAQQKADEATQREQAVSEVAEKKLEDAKKANKIAQKELEDEKKYTEIARKSLDQKRKEVHDLIDTENHELREEKSGLKQKVEKLEQEVEKLSKDSDNYQETVNSPRSRFSNAVDALDYAEKIFPILEIWDSAKESAISGNGGLCYSPDRVFKDLSILAQVGSDSFQGLLKNSIHKCLDERGVDSSPESDTVKKQRNARRFSNHGTTIDMYDHLKIGELRIYFYLSKNDKKIKIGYCGRHL